MAIDVSAEKVPTYAPLGPYTTPSRTSDGEGKKLLVNVVAKPSI
jgi:hypothetical protein